MANKDHEKEIGNSWGGGGVIHDPSGTEIPRGWGVKSEEPSVGGVWIFSGITQCISQFQLDCTHLLVLRLKSPVIGCITTIPLQINFQKLCNHLPLCIKKVKAHTSQRPTQPELILVSAA